MEPRRVRFERPDGWIEVEHPDKLTASSQAILDSEIGPNELQIRNLPSDKDDFLLAIKANKLSLEPLETAHRTISMCQLGLISIQTDSKIKWSPDTEEIIGDNAATALLNRPIREKYFKF
jgi:myo-inositol 2-dehydrogenase/D-chiro-inositol 1-dehydrogenase